MARNVTHVEFSAYDPGITKPSVGTQYTLNGPDNANFKKYQDAYDDSPTNAFIIKTIVNYIVGNGLEDKNGKIKPHDYISKQDLRLICNDFKITGSAFPQIINFQKKPIAIKHTPSMRVGLNIDINPRSNNYMEVNGFWYCWDYKQKFQYPPKFYPMFGDSEGIEIMHIKQLSNEPYYPFPDWFSGLKSAKIESALIDDAINHVTRGFQGKTVINVNNGSMMSEEEKEETKKQVKEGWTGTENADGVTIAINDSPEEAIVVDTIEPRGRNEQFVTYDETAEIKLMAAHSAMNILFQRPGSSGFSNNAEEIATATDSLYLGVINPMREILLDSFNKIFKKIDPECDIDFVNFGQEKAIISSPDEQSKEVIKMYNENRDDNGRFASGEGGSSGLKSEKTSAELSQDLRALEKKGLTFRDKEHQDLSDKISEVRKRENEERTRLRRESNRPPAPRMSKEQIDRHTNDLEKEISKKGLFVTTAKSVTSAGNSNYVEVYENEDAFENMRKGMKIRISDHTVTNINRIRNERHFDGSDIDKKALLEDVDKVFNLKKK